MLWVDLEGFMYAEELARMFACLSCHYLCMGLTLTVLGNVSGFHVTSHHSDRNATVYHCDDMSLTERHGPVCKTGKM